jgi:arylsulfatase A-like enzyme
MAQFGKCHEVPVWETSPMGPFDAWPTGGGGFKYFYGFLGGETHQYYPALYEGTTPVEPNRTPEEGYHLTEDLTTKAIKWVRQQKALMPDKPFSSTSRPARRTPRTTCRASGPTGTRANSTRAGTSCARRASPARRRWA